jgi:glycosyltransferase involved in cell wall biosynthesis
MPDGRPWPKLTVVTPNYNYEHFLEETIRSVLLQGYPDLEYIIIDDGSKDRSTDVIRKYEKWLAHWHTGENHGQTNAINQGFSRATGEILAWLNSDDTYVPDALGVVAEAMRPGVDIVYGECRYIDGESRTTWEWTTPIPRVEPLGLGEWVTCWKSYPVRQPSTFWRKSVQDSTGRLDESFNYAMDYDLFLRFAEKHHFHHIERMLSNFRLHAISKTVGQSDRFVPEILRASKRYWGEPWSLPYLKTWASSWVYLRSVREASEAINASRVSRLKAAQRLGKSFAAFPFGILVAPRTILTAAFRTAFGWDESARRIRRLFPQWP